MLKEKIRESESPESQKQCKWRNLVFDKDGKSHIGITIWNSPNEAEDRMQKSISINAKKEAEGGSTGFNVIGGIILTSQYAWHMQIPILD